MSRLSSIFPWTLLLGSTSVLLGQVPAFPGAEGFGSISTGGRGGDVYYVTNLNASGAGSFTDGVQNAPVAGRTILFAVSGHIRLPSGSGGGLSISKNKITVAGQTAPGGGICFWNNTMNITGNDIVLRNLRWRYGKQTAGGDSVDIANSQRIILDHCDVMFSTDENLSSFGTPPEFFTFQWSVNAWGLNGHSCGGLWDINHATAHHTLWANNHTRNPKCISPSVFDWVNNVTFGWDNGFNMAASTDPIARVNIRGSYFIHGGNTTEAVYGGGLNTLGENIFKLHMSDSALDGTANGILDVNRTNYGMVNSSQYDQIATAWPQTVDGVTGGAIVGTPVTLDSRSAAHKKVLSQAGATRMEIGTRALRDEITQLCVTRVANMQRGIISDPLELGLSTDTAFATLDSAKAPVDTDLDGMPDFWEEPLGLSTTVANNNAVLTAPQLAASWFPAGSPVGYTQLEEYLHFLAVPHGTVPKNTAASPSYLDVDLRKFTSGFTASPVFTTSNVTGGTVTASGPGNSIVRFTPTQDLSGRAGFQFTVTDSAGATWTQQCCLLISTQPQPRPVTWVGDGTANNWDSSTLNFTSALGTTAFAAGDAVTFNDSGSNTPTIKVVGALSPGSLIVDNSSKNFTIEGAGSLSGSGGLTKTGTGSLTLKVNYSGTGPGLIDGSTVTLGGTANTGTLPSGQLTLQNNAVITNAWPSTGSTQNISAPLFIPEGHSATINTGRRLNLSGAVTGDGDLNIVNQNTDGVLEFRGSMGAFAGNLNISFTGTNGNSKVVFNGASFTGWAGAQVSFPAGMTLSCTTNSTGNTFGIGELNGAGTLGGGTAGSPVYTIGGLNTDSVFSGIFSGNAKLTKTGSGILTLSGNSSHNAATTVSAGSLALLGNFSTSPVSVSANATLSGNGTMGGSLTTSAGAILSPGASNGAASGTLTTASLNLVSPTLRFDLSDNPVSGNDRIQVSGGGAISLSGNLNFIFNLTNGTLNPGTYDLITTSGTLTSSGLSFSSNLPTGSRQTLTLEASPSGTAPGYVRLVVSGTNANLTWSGSNGGLWDLQTTSAWTGASPAVFYNSDNVTFNDTASSGSVTITQPVAPRSITFANSALSYTLTGAPITGNTSLVKSGTGTLTLNVPQYTLSCGITAGSAIVTTAATTGIVPGMTVTGTGIPTGSTVISLASGSLTLSAAATATNVAASLVFETRHTFSGGTFLNGGTLLLDSNATPLSGASAPANPYGLGSGPITFNGGSLNLHGHLGNLSAIYGALPNELIIPAGQTGSLFDTVRGINSVPYPSITGALTGAGTLNLTVNYYRSAITGDWSAFSGILNVKRPIAGASDPRIQLGTDTGMPLAAVNLEQVRLEYTSGSSTQAVINFGSLAGISTSAISGSQNATGPITWRVGSLNTSTTYAGNFTPFSGGGPIALAKSGNGTWTLTGAGTVDAGITVESGTLSYGDASTDTLGGLGEITIYPAATLQLNSGAKITGTSAEIFIGGTLKGRGTLQSPLTCNGTVSVLAGTLSISGEANLIGTTEFSALSDRVAVTGNLNLAGTLKLPGSGLTTGRKPLLTYTGALNTGQVAFTNVPNTFIPVLDIATAGEVAVNLVDRSAYQAWQVANFSNTTDPNGATDADPDADGMTNLDEYLAGTDPKSNASYIPLVWQGNTNNIWDQGISSTWLENTTPRVFRDNRQVTVSDTGSNSPALDLTGVLQPGSLTVNNSTKAFTLSGSGSLQGSMALTKSGTGTLTIATENSYAGQTAINSGVVTVQADTALGSAASGTSVAANARLELTGGVTITGEPLSIAGTGGTAFFNGALNSKSGVNTWTGPISITAANTRIGSQAGSTLIVSGTISGTTGITIRPNDMTAVVILSGSNNYTGDTSIVGGVLKIGAANSLPITTAVKLGLSNVSGKFDLNGFNQEVSAISVVSGTTNEITSATPAILTVNTPSNITYSGILTGGLVLEKSGAGTLTLSSSTALASTTSVRINSGAIGLSATHTVTALRINGVWQPAGTYNASNGQSRITGAGSLVVTTSGPAGFNSWIGGYPGVSDTTPAGDPDRDGIANLMEYVLGGNPGAADPAVLPSASVTSTDFVFTFSRRENSTTDTTQVFEYGSLTGLWTPVGIAPTPAAQISLGTASGGFRPVTVTIPKSSATDGRIFGRLKVSQP